MWRPGLVAAADAERYPDARSRRAPQRTPVGDSSRPGDTSHAGCSMAASQRPGGAWQAAHRGGGPEMPRSAQEGGLGVWSSCVVGYSDGKTRLH
jgi:hypothetical protein